MILSVDIACFHRTHYNGGTPLYINWDEYNITSRWDWITKCEYICQSDPNCNYINRYYSSMNPSCQLFTVGNNTITDNGIHIGRFSTTIVKRGNYKELCSLILPECDVDGCCYIKDDILYGKNLNSKCVHYNSNYNVKLSVNNSMIFHHLGQDGIPTEIEQYSELDCNSNSYMAYDTKQCNILDHLNRPININIERLESNGYMISTVSVFILIINLII